MNFDPELLVCSRRFVEDYPTFPLPTTTCSLSALSEDIMNTPRVEIFPNIPSSNSDHTFDNRWATLRTIKYTYQTGSDRSIYGSQFTVDPKLLITCTIFVVVPTGKILS